MYEIIIKTYPFTENFLKYDLKRNDIIKLNDTDFQINIETENELKEFITHCLYFSKLIKNVYLKKDTINQEISEQIETSLNNNELIDLLGFDLSIRDYKLNKSKSTLNPILINYCLYQLGLDEEEEYSILDPLAGTGEIIIETSIFASKKPLNFQKRTKLPFNKLFNFFPDIPKKEETKNKVIAFVQENMDFKELKENLNYIGTKIKMSKFELDWLDIKFKESQIDFAITQITPENEDKLDELLYMLAFVISDAILLVSYKEISKEIIKKYELEIEFEEKISIENQDFFITILE